MRALALFEYFKGFAALAAGLLACTPWDLSVPTDSPLVGLAQWGRTPHGTLAWTFAGYAAMRLVEATGLWRGDRWARWFSVAGYASAVPLEAWQLLTAPRWWTLPVIAINVAVIALLVLRRLRRAEPVDRIPGNDKPLVHPPRLQR